MQHRAGRVDRQSAHNSHLQARDIEPERTQPAAKQHVLLKTIAAASAGDHFPLQRAEVELWRAIQQHVDAFIRNRRGMRLNDATQRLKHRSTWSAISDTK